MNGHRKLIWVSVTLVGVSAAIFFGLVTYAVVANAVFRGIGANDFRDSAVATIVAGILMFIGLGLVVWGFSRLLNIVERK